MSRPLRRAQRRDNEGSRSLRQVERAERACGVSVRCDVNGSVYRVQGISPRLPTSGRRAVDAERPLGLFMSVEHARVEPRGRSNWAVSSSCFGAHPSRWWTRAHDLAGRVCASANRHHPRSIKCGPARVASAIACSPTCSVMKQPMSPVARYSAAHVVRHRSRLRAFVDRRMALQTTSNDPAIDSRRHRVQ